MAAYKQVAMPSQDRVRTHQQPQVAQHAPRKPVQHRGEEGPVAQLNRTFFLPSWRHSTESSWRRARISASFSRPPIGSTRSRAR